MADACVTLPTLTRVDQQVGQQVIQTQVPFTSTLPPTFLTNTISTEICSTNTTSPTSSVCTATFVTSVSTVAGGTTVVIVTSEITNPVTSSVTTTLFTTSCSTSTPNTPDNPSTPVVPPPSTTTPSSSTINTITTGSGTVPTLTSTTTSTSQTPSPTTQGDNSSQRSGSNVAAIAGGAAGGVVGLLALALLTWYYFKKANGLDQVFNKSDDYEKTHNKLGPLDDNSQGYQYGPLGQGGNTTGPAPPLNGPPPPGGIGQGVGYQPSGNEIGYQPGGHLNDTGFYHPTGNEAGYQPSGNEMGHQPDFNHIRNPSGLPLLALAGAAAGGVAAGGAAGYAAGSSRPSTGGSTHPLISPNQQQQGYSPQGYGPNTYPPNPPLPPNQMYGGPAQGQPYYGSDQSHGYPSGQGHAQGHSPNPSLGATSRVGGSSPFNPSSQNMSSTVVGGAAAAGYGQQFSPENRSGSPVSIQEQRVLQVINPDTSYGAAGGSSSFAMYGDGSASGRQPASPTPAPSIPIDGKGRPVTMAGQMVPLVHLDGGRYEEPLTAPTPTPGGTLPPSYYNS